MEWLTLKQAAEQLGVHVSTLRRWADNGSIPFMRTPGGHRRFALKDVDQFARGRQRNATGTLEQIWAERALSTTRAGLTTSADQRWISAFSDEKKMEQRILGRRLMGLLLQYLSDGAADADMLAEAREIGMLSGRNSQQMGLSLVEALEATMFFRDTVVETAIQLPKSTRTRSDANVRLLRRINRFMNTVQLAIANCYDQPLLSGA